tara:strand:+ start:1080 stop:1283 length:204 start_codon:yes stop_codon:yes gene_type:complete
MKPNSFPQVPARMQARPEVTFIRNQMRLARMQRQSVHAEPAVAIEAAEMERYLKQRLKKVEAEGAGA